MLLHKSDGSGIVARLVGVSERIQQVRFSPDGKRLAVARLSDVTGGALRCAVGEGELELAAYRVAVDLAPSRAGPVVLDLRGVEDPIKAARAAAAAWDNAAFAG